VRGERRGEREGEESERVEKRRRVRKERETQVGIRIIGDAGPVLKRCGCCL